jgi:hypothetical protein
MYLAVAVWALTDPAIKKAVPNARMKNEDLFLKCTTKHLLCVE